jgi:multicomponent Na+:H+ antiporter subunit G
MSFLLDVFTVAAVSAGAFFFLAGSVGLLRFPDALSRLHALTKADNLGLGLVMLGLLPRAGSFAALKLVFVWLLVLRQRDGIAARCPRRAAGVLRCDGASALAIVLSLVLLAIAAWTIAGAPNVRRSRGFRRLWPAARSPGWL